MYNNAGEVNVPPGVEIVVIHYTSFTVRTAVNENDASSRDVIVIVLLEVEGQVDEVV